jgi:hypothetical protein
MFLPILSGFADLPIAFSFRQAGSQYPTILPQDAGSCPEPGTWFNEQHDPLIPVVAMRI